MVKANAILPLLLSGLLVGCAPTQTQRAPGQAFDDVTVTAKVKTAIAKTSGLGEAASINVDTYRGVVSLAGFVDNAQQVAEATRVAAGVPGVDKVVNNLQVKTRP